MSKLLKIISLSAIIFIFSCQRSVNEQSLVSINVGSTSSAHSSKVGSLACTKCLKGIVINVSGSGFSTIKYSKMPSGDIDDGSEISGEVTLEVPSGDQRQFQIMTIYRETVAGVKKISLHYGSTLANLNAAETTVNIGLSGIGEFKGGSIAGRYLTGVESGPTGKVIVSLKPQGANGLEMDIEETEIINGWFNFFGSQNIPMNYRLADGTVLFSNTTIDSIQSGAMTPQDRIARIYRPFSYYRQANSGWELESEYHDLIYGFFGSPSFTANKHICVQHSNGTNLFMSRVAASSDGSSLLSYIDDYSLAVSGQFSRVGGILSNNASSDCTSLASEDASYKSGRINVRVEQIDGRGNDTAASISGAFTYVKFGGNHAKFAYLASTDYTLRFLPGVASGNNPLFDGVTIYSKANSAMGGYDKVSCTSDWLSSKGFTAIPSNRLSISVSNDVTSLQFSAGSVPPSSDGTIACPTKSGQLTGLGGFYLGGLEYPGI